MSVLFDAWQQGNYICCWTFRTTNQYPSGRDSNITYIFEVPVFAWLFYSHFHLVLLRSYASVPLKQTHSGTLKHSACHIVVCQPDKAAVSLLVVFHCCYPLQSVGGYHVDAQEEQMNHSLSVRCEKCSCYNCNTLRTNRADVTCPSSNAYWSAID